MKRFTDTDKYKKPFIRGLKGAYKLLWDYLYHECDNSGVWIVDFDIAQIYLGMDMPVNKAEALEVFNKDEVKIIEIHGGKKWFIPSFLTFQYGELSPENRFHKSVLLKLSQNGIDLNKPLTSHLQGAKDKNKKKDMEKDEEPEYEIINVAFQKFWNLYDKKVGDKEKVKTKFLALKPEDKEKIFEHLPAYILSTPDKKFRKDPATYLNNKAWNDEIIIPTFKQKNNEPRIYTAEDFKD